MNPQMLNPGGLPFPGGSFNNPYDQLVNQTVINWQSLSGVQGINNPVEAKTTKQNWLHSVSVSQDLFFTSCYMGGSISLI